MSYFAQIDSNNIVTQVLILEQDEVDSGLHGDPQSFILACPDTHGNTHQLGGTPFRKNFPDSGYLYDIVRDAFIPPKPFDSWVLNEETCLWKAPIPVPPGSSMNKWDEDTLSWIAIPDK